MAKKLTKIEVEDKERYLDEIIILIEGDILTKTCDIYKFNLSKKSKIAQLEVRTDQNIDDFDDVSEFDFYLLRIKDSVLEKLNNKKIRFLYMADMFGDDATAIYNLDELVDCIDDYITVVNTGESLFDRANKKDLVYFIPNLGSMI
jgi:hypothetical protein